MPNHELELKHALDSAANDYLHTASVEGLDPEASAAFCAGALWLLEQAKATTDNAASSSKDWNNGWLEGKRAIIKELEELCK